MENQRDTHSEGKFIEKIDESISKIVYFIGDYKKWSYKNITKSNRELLKKAFTFRYPVTTFTGSLGTYSLIADGDIKAFLTMFGAGLIADGVKNTLVSKRLKKLKNQDSKLAKVLDIDYFDGIIDSLRKFYDCSGRCNVTELMERQEGTGILKKGYITDLVLKFEDGNEVKLMFKYNDKQGLKSGAKISSILCNKGYNFVPKRFIPFISPRIINSDLNRGQIYEWIKGNSLEEILIKGDKNLVENHDNILDVAQDTKVVENIFSNMFSIYSDDSLVEENGNFKRFKFHNDLINNLRNNKNNDFANDLEAEYESIFRDSQVRLIHGDLHQGNIMKSKEKTHIIDWDSVQLGIPYQDFFHFSVISDFEKSFTYNEVKNKFLDKQSEILPTLKKEHLKLIEFETYLSLLNRYYKAVKDKKIIPEFRENMLLSCKYLFEKSKNTLDEYAKLINDNKILELYNNFSIQKFKKLEKIAFNPNASISYSHTVNHKYIKVNKKNKALENWENHRKSTESVVISEESLRAVPLADIALLSLMSVPVIGFGLYGIHTDEANSELYKEHIIKSLKLLGSVTALGLYVYNAERIMNGAIKSGYKIYKFLKGLKK
tara:strand:+ start:2935 stop:4740 length:1806 start_codon:yes stop_codon:yes gene_type:complete